MRDLLVAGGGPVGLATALHAARAGLDVAVLEPRRGVIDKACGEGLMPGALAELAGLGVDPDGWELTGIRYLDGERAATAGFRRGPGRGVRRTTLHAALADAVAAAGVETVPRAVRRVEQREDHVLVDGEPTRHVVAADGLHSPVRRLLGLDAPVTGHRRYGQRCHLELAPWGSFVEVHWSPVGEAYVTPLGPRLVGLAVLSSQRRPLAELLAGFGSLRERLPARLFEEPAEPPGELRGGVRGGVRGAGPLRQRARAKVAGRVLLVGDAAGYVDALTGEGLAVGLAQARAAVAAVRAGHPGDYARAARRIGWRHELLTHGLLVATRSRRVRDRLVPAAAGLPGVFGGVVDQLARPA